MADTKEQKRKPAPTAEAILNQSDERSQILERCNKKYPENVHKFHRRDVKDYDLERNGYEKLIENGEVVNHNGDPVVFRPKALDQEVKKLRNSRSHETVKQAMKYSEGGGELKQVAKAKRPTNNGD